MSVSQLGEEVFTTPTPLPLIRGLVTRNTKTVVFTNRAFAHLLHGELSSIGANVHVRRTEQSIVMTEAVLSEFEKADNAVLVVPYSFNTGWRVGGVKAFIFLDVPVNTRSAAFHQCLGRSDVVDPDVYFVNCHLN